MNAETAVALSGLSHSDVAALQLMKNVALAANGAGSLDEAFGIACGEILTFTGWYGAAAFLPDERDELRVTGIYGGLNEEVAAGMVDRELVTTWRWRAGHGMPGRVLASQLAEWASEDDFRSNPAAFPRRESLARIGIKSSLAFPAMIGERVGGVMIFFTKEHVEPDAQLLALMSDIGVQLGRAVEREEAAQQRMRLYDLLDTIINSMPSVLIAVDRETRVTRWNSEAIAITKTSAAEASGRLLEEVFNLPKQLLEKVRLSAREGAAFHEQQMDLDRDGGSRLMEATIYPLSGEEKGAVVRIDDITRRAQMEQLLIQTQKLSSLGALAAGMAHEINNPLAGMMQNAQVVLARTQADLAPNRAAAEKRGTTIEAVRGYLEDRSIVEMLEAIRSSGARVAETMRNMLGFIRPATAQMTKRDVRALIDDAVVLAGNDYDLRKTCDFRHAEIVREFEADLPEIECFTTEIQQVFLNLLKHTVMAMHKEPGRTAPPRIVLRARRDGENVRAELEDDAVTMDESQRRRIFEPFCEMNDPNRSNGLALSVAHFIVTRNHHGTIRCEPGTGRRNIFVITLPIEQPEGKST